MTKTRRFLLALTMLGLVGAAWWWQHPLADLAQHRTVSIERDSLQTTVSARGALNPVTGVSGQRLTNMQVDASVDASAAVRIHAGQRATFTVAAFPDQIVNGEVRQVPNAALRMRIADIEPAAAGGAVLVSGAAMGNAGDGSWSSSAHAQLAGGAFAGQRERLVSELQLDSDQRTKLDVIYADMRPRLTALADMEQAQRAPAREKLLADMRQKINAMLTPDQRAAYELMQARKEQERAKRSIGPGTGKSAGA